MTRSNPYTFFFSSLIFIFVALMTFLILHPHLSFPYAYLTATNTTGLIIMGLDKSFARSGSLRVPEIMLHAIALFGGSFGVFLGMNIFRHKSRKPTFQIILLIIASAQLMLARMLGMAMRM